MCRFCLQQAVENWALKQKPKVVVGVVLLVNELHYSNYDVLSTRLRLVFWNSLPLGLKTNCDSLRGFKTGLKTYLFRQDYN